MSPLIQGVVIALVPLLVLQTGALIFYAGSVAATLRNLHDQFKDVKQDVRELRAAVFNEERGTL